MNKKDIIKNRKVIANFDVNFSMIQSLTAWPELVDFVNRMFPIEMNDEFSYNNPDEEIDHQLRLINRSYRLVKAIKSGKMVSGVDVLGSLAWMRLVKKDARPVARYDSSKFDLDYLIRHFFEFADNNDVKIDSIWWNFSEGNQATYRSKRLPSIDIPVFQRWIKDDIDIVQILQEETHKRGIEAFYSHRMNGSDNEGHGQATIPMKESHPEWLFTGNGGTKIWNFAIKELRQYILENLTEIVENYDYDGLELNFARGYVLPPGRQWELRDSVTDFVTSVRKMLLELETKGRRPCLLAVRLPETIVGCHFDGLDVKTWIDDGLMDIISLGCRSFEVDIESFRSLTKTLPIYPTLDAHHASDGYMDPGINVLRGGVANWFNQGADGIQTFNFTYAKDSPYGGEDWKSHLDLYKELTLTDGFKMKDKTFIIERRGGGHSASVIPNAEDWYTPTFGYANTNMLAQLPEKIPNNPNQDCLLTINVSDDLKENIDKISFVNLQILLSDGPSSTKNPEKRADSVEVATIGHGGVLYNNPLDKSANKNIGVRINNIELKNPCMRNGWVLFNLDPTYLAVGENLVGVHLLNSKVKKNRLLEIEKLEIHVVYKKLV